MCFQSAQALSGPFSEMGRKRKRDADVSALIVPGSDHGDDASQPSVDAEPERQERAMAGKMLEEMGRGD